MSGRKSFTERRNRILKRAFKNGHPQETIEKIQSLRRGSLEGYVGDKEITRSLFRAVAEELQKQAPSSRRLFMRPVEDMAPDRVLN
jgi:hypothetical protein